MKLVFIGLQINASQMYYNNEEVFDGNDNMLSIWRHYGTIMEPVRATAYRAPTKFFLSGLLQV